MKSKCPKCGQEFEGDYDFCPKCGSSIAHTNKKITCSKCGCEYESDYDFCPKCGEKTSNLVDNLQTSQSKNINSDTSIYKSSGFKKIVKSDVIVRIVMYSISILFLLTFSFTPFFVRDKNESFFTMSIFGIKNFTVGYSALLWLCLLIVFFSIVVLGFMIFALVKECKKISNIDETSKKLYEEVSDKYYDEVKSYIRNQMGKTSFSNVITDTCVEIIFGFFIIMIMIESIARSYGEVVFYKSINASLAIPIIFFVGFIGLSIADWAIKRYVKKRFIQKKQDD